MIALIPLMGKSSRFVNAELPEKPFLKMPDGRTLLEWVVELLPSEVKDIAFIVPANNHRLKELARKITKNLHLILLSNPTRDPLDTLCEAGSFFSETNDEPLYINYVDCLLYQADDFVESMKMQSASAGAVVFDSDEKRFQYSENSKAFSGLFWFEHANEFFKKTVEQRAMARALGWETVEFGAPHIVQQYPNYKVYDVGAGSELFDLGTPEEYLKFMGRKA